MVKKVNQAKIKEDFEKRIKNAKIRVDYQLDHWRDCIKILEEDYDTQSDSRVIKRESVDWLYQMGYSIGVSMFESYVRDTFKDVISLGIINFNDTKFPSKISIADFQFAQQESIPIGELAAKLYSFQNLDKINQAF